MASLDRDMLTLTCGAVQVLWHDKMLPSLGPEYQTLRPALGRTAGKFASFLLWARAGMAKLQVRRRRRSETLSMMIETRADP